MKIIDAKQVTEKGWKEVGDDFPDICEYERKIEKMMTDVHSFTLITIDENGTPVARAMSLKASDGIKRIWFATHRSSDHAGVIMKNPKVTVFFNNMDTYEGLMFSGTACVEKDRENMQRCWREFYKDSFRGGIDDPEFLSIRIEPDSGNYAGGGVKIRFTVD